MSRHSCRSYFPITHLLAQSLAHSTPPCLLGLSHRPESSTHLEYFINCFLPVPNNSLEKAYQRQYFPTTSLIFTTETCSYQPKPEIATLLKVILKWIDAVITGLKNKPMYHMVILVNIETYDSHKCCDTGWLKLNNKISTWMVTVGWRILN